MLSIKFLQTIKEQGGKVGDEVVYASILGLNSYLLGRHVFEIPSNTSFAAGFASFFVANFIRTATAPVFNAIGRAFQNFGEIFSEDTGSIARHTFEMIIGNLGCWTLGALATREILDLRLISKTAFTGLVVTAMLVTDIFSGTLEHLTK